MSPLLSIVTVCRNAASTIEQTLCSVDLLLAQSPAVEHLVVDGASTDATISILSRHPNPGRRVISEPDRGLYDAMNKGLRQAGGAYVWFLNADDYLLPIEHGTWCPMLGILQIGRPLVLIGEVQMFKETPNGPKPTRYWRVPKNVARALDLGWHPPHPAFIADRLLLIKLGGFDVTKRIAADFKLMAQAMRATSDRVATIQHPLVAMREGGVSNGSVGSIFKANVECYLSLRELGASHLGATLGVFAKLTRKVAQKFIPFRGSKERMA